MLPRYYDILPSDELQSELDKHHHYGSFQSGWRYQHRKRIDFLGESVNGLDLPSDARVIDVGCGRGPNSIQLGKRGFSVVGLDVDPLELMEARRWLEETRNFRCAFVQGDAHRLPFRNQSVDLVVCSEILEHLTRPELALEEMKRVLKPSGYVVITMPNLLGYHWSELKIFYWLRAVCTGKHLEDWEAKQHLRYPFWRIEHLIRSNGFRIISRSGTVIVAPWFKVPNRFYKWFPNVPIFTMLDKIFKILSILLERLEWPLRWHRPFIWFAVVYGIVAKAE